MTFLLQINDLEAKIPIVSMSESVNSKRENDPNAPFGIIYSIDFNVVQGINYTNIMNIIEEYFYNDTISSLTVYDSEGERILYETTRYTELDGEYLYLDENGVQSLTIHVQKDATINNNEE